MISWLLLEQNRSRLFRWTTIFGGFAVVQVLVQVLNASAGFLLVRTMEKPDYAWFTIASGMSAALAVLSDSGVGIAVTSIGGSIWQDKASLKGLVHAALRLRLRLAAVASAVVAAISLWLLLRNGTGMALAFGLTILVLAPIWQISTTAVLNVVNRLHSRNRELQLADLVPALVRAGLTAAVAQLGGISSLSALGVVVIAQFIQFIIVRCQVLPLLGVETEVRQVQDHAGRIWKMVCRFLPSTVFWCLQGQVATWLISLVATTKEVADFGALNRLGILFVVIGGPLGQFIIPAVARCMDRRRLWAVALALVAGMVGFSTLLLTFAWWKGGWFLWLLGSKYAHLQYELLLVLAGMAVNSLTATITALNNVQGWIRLAWLYIPVTLIVQAIAASMINLESIEGLAWFIISTGVVQCCHASINCLVGLTNPDLICVK